MKQIIEKWLNESQINCAHKRIRKSVANAFAKGEKNVTIKHGNNVITINFDELSITENKLPFAYILIDKANKKTFFITYDEWEFIEKFAYIIGYQHSIYKLLATHGYYYIDL